MAPTTTTALPLVLRASFLFSGMFGIRLDGLKDHNGHPITVQSAMPLNFTVPAIVMDPATTSVQKSQLNTHFALNGRIDNVRCLDKCKTGNDIKNNGNSNNNQINPFLNSIKNKTSAVGITNNGNNKNSSSNNNGSELVMQLPLLELFATTLRPVSTTKMPPVEKPCGPGKCSNEEICVSWMKESGNEHKKNLLVSRRESPMMVHECLPNDGIHWTKMNPTGARLCERGKTHSIIANQSHRNCIESSSSSAVEISSCDVIWHYACVDEKDSPHSCSLRQCPFKGACIEVKHCDLRHLCHLEAVCTPEFLIPDKLRHNIRRKPENRAAIKH